MNFYQKYVKRFFDIVLCTFAMIVLSPIFIITAIAIKLSSPGPVFYFSERAGLHKKPFLANKFLTTTKRLLNDYFSEGQKALKAA